MNAQANNTANAQQQAACTDSQAISDMSREQLKAEYAEALLDQVDAAQAQIRNLQDDISLLQTAENALDLISENMAKIRRLVAEKQKYTTSRSATAALNDEIRNLLMVNMLVAEDTELNGHRLFRDDIIRMSCCTNDELTLTTTQLPEIAGIDTNDTQATLDSLDIAARTINRQYNRIADLMRGLMEYYQQLRGETILLMNAQLLFVKD